MSEQQGKYNIEQIKRENAAMRKYAAIQKASEEQIGCQKIYVDIAGGIIEAFILDELMFFTLPRPETGKSGLRVWKDGVLWMAVSRTEWWDRKRITAKQADGAIDRLVKSGLVYRDYFLFNKQRTTHLRINIPEFFKRYTEELDNQNPPEDQNDTVQRDIADLYEMMGVPKSNTHETTPKMEEGIPEGDKVSPNSDSINIPHTTSTQPPLIINPILQMFVDVFGRFKSEKELEQWRAIYESAGEEKAKAIIAWALKKEIHLVNRASLLDSMETAAKGWKEKPQRANGKTPPPPAEPKVFEGIRQFLAEQGVING